MSRATIGQVGIQVPWKQIEAVSMLVESWSGLGAILENGKLKKLLSGIMPASTATVEVLLTDPGAIEANGSESLWLSLPVENVDDFRVFSWLFEERGIADDEDVMAMYLPAKGLFSGGKSRFAVMVLPKGSIRMIYDAVQRGEQEPNVEKIWEHVPRTPFSPPQQQA